MTPANKQLPPVLLIIFNRPDKVRQLVAALADIKPTEVYIAADGPRSHKPGEAALCIKAREIATQLPWPCTVHTNFQSSNLGCRLGVSTAINWFFDNVEEGIILEDDCIPTPDFFSFTTELLERYRSDAQVMHISGSTFIPPSSATSIRTSYYVSHISLIWGWATWRRAWRQYDISMKALDTKELRTLARTTFVRASFAQFWLDLFTHVRDAPVDTWDAQWLYSIMQARGVCITPTHNLIHNIGFDQSATHTTEAVSFAQGVHPLAFPLTHPPSLAVAADTDELTMTIAFIDTPKKRLKYFIRSLLTL